MDETYRMLGREHEADLERDARKHRLAGELRARRRPRAESTETNPRRVRAQVLVARIAALLR